MLRHPCWRRLIVSGLIIAVALAACSPSTPVPNASAGTTVRPTQPPPTATATPQSSLSGSVPETILGTWHRITVSTLVGGPAGAESVVAWAGGYAALGAFGLDLPMRGWISRDGRSWIELPTVTVAGMSDAIAAPLGSGLLILGTDPSGVLLEARSSDGVTWSSSRVQPLKLARVRSLAGGERGAVAVVESSSNTLMASSDGVSWASVTLPGPGQFDVQDVAATRAGFIAVGSVIPPAAATGIVLAASRPIPIWPAAWSSTDGRTWSQVDVPRDLQGEFGDVEVGASGLIAGSFCCGAPGLYSRWASGDAVHWRPTLADPLGTGLQGEGAGSANGLFSGDGSRLLVYGSSDANAMRPPEFWTSLDGMAWTQLELNGDASVALAADPTPFLLRDGVLLVGRSQVWYGAASP